MPGWLSHPTGMLGIEPAANYTHVIHRQSAPSEKEPDMEQLRIAVVHVEPCLTFVDDVDAPDEVCQACGWLVEEHAVPVAA